jgi:hypothetical protein
MVSPEFMPRPGASSTGPGEFDMGLRKSGGAYCPALNTPGFSGPSTVSAPTAPFITRKTL